MVQWVMMVLCLMMCIWFKTHMVGDNSENCPLASICEVHLINPINK